MKGALALIIVSLLPGAAPARSDILQYTEGDARAWEAAENRHDAVLRRERTILYLGRGCDARSSQLGRGRWGSANGGLLVTFPRRTIGFPRQEPPIRGSRCGL